MNWTYVNINNTNNEISINKTFLECYFNVNSNPVIHWLLEQDFIFTLISNWESVRFYLPSKPDGAYAVNGSTFSPLYTFVVTNTELGWLSSVVGIL